MNGLLERIELLEYGKATQQETVQIRGEIIKDLQDAWDEALEREQLILGKLDEAIAERDEALRRAKESCLNRGAVLMNGESQRAKKIAKLEDRLGEGKNWMKVEFIPWLQEFFPGADMTAVKQVVGIQLTNWCKQKGYPIRKVMDDRYGQVNAYSVLAVASYHKFLKNSPSQLKKYAKLLKTQ